MTAHSVSTIALPRWRPPLLQLVLALTVTVGVLVNLSALWVAVGLVQLLLVVSWHHALGATDARAGALVAGVLILASDVAVAIRADTTFYGPIAVVVSVGFLLAVTQQLARRDGRADLTLSLAATVSLAAVGALGAGWVINLRLADGADLTAVAALAVAGAALGRLVPGLAGVAGALLAGVAVAAAVGAGLSTVGVGLGAAVGFAAAVPSALAAVVAVRAGERLPGWPVGSTWPVLLAPGLAYLVIRIAGQ